MHPNIFNRFFHSPGWAPSAALMALLAGAGVLLPAAQAGQSAAKQPLALTLQKATELALKNNLQTQLAREGILQANGEKGLSRSALLPNLSGAAYGEFQPVAANDTADGRRLNRRIEIVMLPNLDVIADSTITG